MPKICYEVLMMEDSTTVGVSEGSGVVSNSDRGSVVGNGEWGVVGNGDWSSETGNWGSDGTDGWDGNGGLDDGRGRPVDDSVESVDGISGVGDGPHSTIGLNKGVLSLDDISITLLMGRVVVSGEGISDGVSVVVLWVRVVWLGTDGWGNSSNTSDGSSNSNWSVVSNGDWGGVVEGWSSNGVSHWGVGVGKGWGGHGSVVHLTVGIGVSVEVQALWGNHSSRGCCSEGKDSHDLHHFAMHFFCLSAWLVLCQMGDC